MPNWTKSAKPRQIDILLFDQFSNHCLANALEPFRAANTLLGQDAYRWRLYSLDGAPVRSSSDISVMVTAALGPEQRGDMLFVISSYAYQSMVTPFVRTALRQAAARAGVCIGLDTGAWLMAEAGLLDGHKATVHWDVLESFSERFLSVEVSPAPHVIDGPMVTCGGAMLAFDLMLEILGDHYGMALKLDVAAMFQPDPERARAEIPSAVAKSPLVRQALRLMQANLETPLPVPELAHRLGSSQKALERRFLADLGAPPNQVYKHLKLAAVRRLLQATDLQIAEVGLRCGYNNPSAMTRAFVQEFGLTPQALRGRK